MKYLQEYRDGDRMLAVYLCKHKQSAVTKNGKTYENVILQDKTGTMDAKVWDPNSAGIGDYGVLDYIEVHGDVSSYQGALQVSIKRIRRIPAEKCNPADYLPVTDKNIDVMVQELGGYIASIKNKYLLALLQEVFLCDEEFAAVFKKSSAAKTVHHGFIGGLLEHTLSIVKLCDYYCSAYPVLNRDLLLTAAMCHDIGKTRELSAFPQNDYTEDGQLLGHIIIGMEMVGEKIRQIPGFPPLLAAQIKHCILSHHGEYEYGSPKKPALIEAIALNFADNTDAKLQSFMELLQSANQKDWLGYNRLFESNLRVTKVEDSDDLEKK